MMKSISKYIELQMKGIEQCMHWLIIFILRLVPADAQMAAQIQQLYAYDGQIA